MRQHRLFNVTFKRPVSFANGSYSATTRTEATQREFWNKIWNWPITSRDLNNEIAHNCTQILSQFKYVANH